MKLWRGGVGAVDVQNAHGCEMCQLDPCVRSGVR